MALREDFHALASATQAEVCRAIEALEAQWGDGATFAEHAWTRPEGGGGRSRLLQDGRVFEKAGVNVSAVFGPLSVEAAAAMRARHADLPAAPTFFATGVSLVLHPHNPRAPTGHANVRYFEVLDGDRVVAAWFGGGIDLTPAYLYEEDARQFHGVLKATCDRHDPAFYARFSAWADDYFLIRHRGERRGIGGIFFDDLPADAATHAFVADVAGAIVPAYVPVVARRHPTAWTDADRRWQLIRRGRYVEFNLVWDRGTTFGLRTGARPESVLMSLPLNARFEDVEPEPGTEERALVDVLRAPRAWA